jgi:tetratricopeptide (TPR) repeat protein
METLYDLLGALPRDDAEELRAAFRRAVKSAHPDINPGDPEAAAKFRQIVRANDILSDGEQRAAYDHLLSLADAERKSISTHAVARAVHRLASAVVVAAVILIALVGSFALALHLSARSDGSPEDIETAARAPAETPSPAPPATPTPPTTVTVAQAEPAPEAPQPAAPQETTPVKAAVVESAPIGPIAPATDPTPLPAAPILPAAMSPTAAIHPPDADSAPPATPPGPPLDITLGDAGSYREQGIIAYRNGDLHGALADFDQAILIDPKLTEAYIDRGIVLYRMRRFERAFADLAHAKKLDRANRRMLLTPPVPGAPTAMAPPGATPPPARRPRFGQGGLAFGMMFPRRTVGME